MDCGQRPHFAEHDHVNRELFNEHCAIIRKAWANPLFCHAGQPWQLPPRGMQWDHPATRTMAPDTVDGKGELVQIGTSRLTLQDLASIETLMPFTMSPATIEWSAAEPITPIMVAPIEQLARGAVGLYHQAAHAADHANEWRRGLGHFREIVVAHTDTHTDTEAYAIMESVLGYVWTRWHELTQTEPRPRRDYQGRGWRQANGNAHDYS